ncbi:MAG: hypothetical protein H6671_09395 [Anaerolineaceae bacterium]|nr:hypothetical protein [Anaerolineaceae bacterium]
MSNLQDVTVKLFDPIRLMSAVLAATDWPLKSQERQPHGTHAHARATRKFLENFTGHPAVQGMQSLLDQGAPLEAVYTLILHLPWPELETESLPRWVPPKWNEHLHDFYQVTNLPKLWKDEGALWKSSLTESQKMFNGVGFKKFLLPFLGEISEDLIFVPNISYPSDQEIGVRIGNQLLCIAPPRLAWGDSPPWPFDEDPTHIYRAALSQYGRMLLMAYLREHSDKITEVAEIPLPVSDQFRSRYPTWQEQFVALFVAAAVALYLEDAVSAAEANAYVLMERKAHGMVILPGMTSVLRRYLSELESGRYTNLLDFLPVFPKQLRVAKKIVSL